MEITSRLRTNFKKGMQELESIGYLYLVSWIMFSVLSSDYIIICSSAVYHATAHNLFATALLAILLSVVAYVAIRYCAFESRRRNRGAIPAQIHLTELQPIPLHYKVLDFLTAIGLSFLGIDEYSVQAFPYLGHSVLPHFSIVLLLHTIGMVLIVGTLTLNAFYGIKTIPDLKQRRSSLITAVFLLSLMAFGFGYTFYNRLEHALGK